MENVFPLLQLLLTEQQRVLRLCGVIDQFAFSTLSKKTTAIVKSAKLKVEFIDLKLSHPLQLDLRFPEMPRLKLYLDYGEGLDKSVEKTPERLILSMHDQPQTTIRSDLTLRDWILFSFDVYHVSCIRVLKYTNQSVVYDLSSIRTALRKIETETIFFRDMINHELFKKAVETFFPIKRLAIDDENRPEDLDSLQRILLQNLDAFCVTAPRISYFDSLDRLLSINASFIYSNSTLTDRTINRFLKLWIRGAMPRLKRLTSFAKQEGFFLKKNVILNGINYIQREPDQEKTGIAEWYLGPEAVTVKGGLSVLKCDGTKATIQFWEREDNVRCMDLIVWDE